MALYPVTAARLHQVIAAQFHPDANPEHVAEVSQQCVRLMLALPSVIIVPPDQMTDPNPVDTLRDGRTMSLEQEVRALVWNMCRFQVAGRVPRLFVQGPIVQGVRRDVA